MVTSPAMDDAAHAAGADDAGSAGPTWLPERIALIQHQYFDLEQCKLSGNGRNSRMSLRLTQVEGARILAVRAPAAPRTSIPGSGRYQVSEEAEHLE